MNDEFRDEEKDPFEVIDDADEEEDEVAATGMHIAGEAEAVEEVDPLDEEEDAGFLTDEAI